MNLLFSLQAFGSWTVSMQDLGDGPRPVGQRRLRKTGAPDLWTVLKQETLAIFNAGEKDRVGHAINQPKVSTDKIWLSDSTCFDNLRFWTFL